MRVIAGRCAGTRLVAPEGEGTRPVADRVKETLFGILADRVVGARVVDLYAGSGALGIEALSRGAARAVFVERHRAATVAIRENLRRTGLADAAEVVVADVDRFLGRAPSESFEVALLDPPYAERAILPRLERLVPWLAPEALVVVKHFWRTPVPAPPGLAEVRTRRFGETALSFLATVRASSTSDA